jgi:hypothetical protein
MGFGYWLLVGYWLLAIGLIGYWLLLLAIGYWLLAIIIGYWLLAIGYWLLAIGYWSCEGSGPAGVATIGTAQAVKGEPRGLSRRDNAGWEWTDGHLPEARGLATGASPCEAWL